MAPYLFIRKTAATRTGSNGPSENFAYLAKIHEWLCRAFGLIFHVRLRFVCLVRSFCQTKP
jgi:hypothetical protein